MKKILFLGLLFVLSASISVCYGLFEPRSVEFYSGLSDNLTNFYDKLKTCSPASSEITKEYVYGKTKNGKCHYSFKEYDKGELKQFQCMLPFNVSYGYATSSLDIINEIKKINSASGIVGDGADYNNQAYAGYSINPEEAVAENNEIRKLLRDYCIIKTK